VARELIRRWHRITSNEFSKIKPMFVTLTASKIAAVPYHSFVAGRGVGTCAPTCQRPVSDTSIEMRVRVLVNPGEPVDSALRRFKKEVVKAGILQEVKRRQFFESNTEKRLRRTALQKQRARQATQRNR